MTAPPSDATDPSRRDFLKALAAGGLLLSVGAPVEATRYVPAVMTSINGWIRIGNNGVVEFLSNTSEIGQGTSTALAQLIAEELDVEWSTVRFGIAPVAPAFINPMWGEYATYGSGGVRGQFTALRTAAARARAMLIGVAADAWKVPPEECVTDRGNVVHHSTKRRFPYSSLVGVASHRPVPAEVPLKPSVNWRLIGAEVRRLDIPEKVDGSARFGIDVRMPGLLIAAIRQSPRFGGRLRHVDAGPALGVNGVRQVVELDDAVAVVAGDYWTATQALARLEPEWDTTQASTVTSAAYTQAQLAAVRAGGAVFTLPGTKTEELVAAYDAVRGRIAAEHEAEFTVPFLAHAPMEPMNGTAHVTADRAELWLSTQGQSATTRAVAAALGLPQDAVEIHTMYSGGGFGRRIEFDFAVQAALVAKRVGGPVKLIWSREEDMRHDFYRPAVALKLKAGVDADGWPVRLRADSACESLLHYSTGGSRANAPPVDPTAVGARPVFYDLGPFLFGVSTLDVGVPVGYWRSVAASQNTFAYECFFDELAHLAGADPLAWRRRLLAKSPRELRVLEAAARRAGWASPPLPGRARGLALVRANGTVVALVVELSISGGRAIRLHRIVAAMDCGVVVNPNSVRAQVEGAVAFGLSAAMYGEITVKDGAVEQSNFNDYPPVRLPELPPVETELLPSEEPPGGVGEEAVGPLAPALVNAIFAATGKRIRTLPLSRAGFALDSAFAGSALSG